MTDLALVERLDTMIEQLNINNEALKYQINLLEEIKNGSKKYKEEINSKDDSRKS